MMYTCEESELGGVRSVSVNEGGREIVAKKLAEKKAALAANAARQDAKPAERQPSKGTPLGRAFRNFLG